MEVRTDFKERMTGLAASLPREVIASLLTRLAPVVPVKTRPPVQQALPDAITTAHALHDASLGRDPFAARAAKRRRRSPKSSARAYTVLRPNAAFNHRRGTWTYYMVRAAVENADTLTAEAWLRANHSEFDHKLIDWAWLAEKMNYIQFN